VNKEEIFSEEDFSHPDFCSFKLPEFSSKVKIKNFRSRFRLSMLRKIAGQPVAKAL
jgi:hypothetical protein